VNLSLADLPIEYVFIIYILLEYKYSIKLQQFLLLWRPEVGAVWVLLLFILFLFGLYAWN
jgi:hypothetical protein